MSVHQHVGRLEISVAHPGFVQGRDGVDHQEDRRAKPRPACCGGLVAEDAGPLVERLAVHKREDHPDRLAFRQHLQRDHHARVLELLH